MPLEMTWQIKAQPANRTYSVGQIGAMRLQSGGKNNKNVLSGVKIKKQRWLENATSGRDALAIGGRGHLYTAERGGAQQQQVDKQS